MSMNFQEMEGFAKRLYLFMQAQDLRNSNELSHHLGYKHSEKIRRLFRSSENRPSYDMLYDIAIKFPDINMDWLITGRGHMLQDPQKEESVPISTALVKTSTSSKDSKDYIPLYDIVATAGSSIKFWESEENVLDYIPRKFGMRDCDLAIHVYGDSMYPLYMPGDVALLKEITDYDIISYGHVYVIITEEHRFMKYVMRTANPEYLLLRSENSHYDDIQVAKKHVIKMYRVQGFFRKTGI